MLEEEKSDRKKSRRFSALSAKKAVASKIGETRLGRSTLIKFLGAEADDIANALKSAVTKIDARDTAKDLKKDLMKWVLKASVLLKEKKITGEAARPLKRPALICAERLLETCQRHPRGSRDLARVSKEFADLAPLLKTLLEPHSQDKNVLKVERIVTYYSDVEFLTRLFNDQDLEEEANIIIESIREILLPLPSALNDVESIRLASMRAKFVAAEVNAPQFALCFDKMHPDFNTLFIQYLDAQPDATQSTALRFILAEHDFAQISAPNIRSARAQVLCDKFLCAAPHDADGAEGASAVQEPAAPIGAISSDGKIVVARDVHNRILAAIEELRATRNTFDAVRDPLQAKLVEIFGQFLASKAYLNYKQSLQKELCELQSTYGERLIAHKQEAGADAAQTQGEIFPVMAPSLAPTCGAGSASA